MGSLRVAPPSAAMAKSQHRYYASLVGSAEDGYAFGYDDQVTLYVRNWEEVPRKLYQVLCCICSVMFNFFKSIGYHAAMVIYVLFDFAFFRFSETLYFVIQED